MEKLIGLLHEGTIVNLRILYQLGTRYKIHFAIAMAFFVLFFSYNYYSQPIIYAVKIPIKLLSKHKVSVDLSELLPTDNVNQVTLEELNITLSNYLFLKSVASELIKNGNFDQFNFGGIVSKKSLLGRKLKDACTPVRSKLREDCLVEKLAMALRGLFYVEHGLTEDRFTLVTNTTDKNTADVLAKLLLKEIEQDRIKVRQYVVVKEIKSVASLIVESRMMIKKMKGYEAIEEQEKLQNNISDLKEKIKMLQYTSSLEVANESFLESKLVENKKTTNSDNDSRQNYDALLKAQARLNDVEMNIGHLAIIPEESRSSSDKIIIAQLLSEKERLLKSLPGKQHLKTIEFDQNFKEKQREVSESFKFDYSVSKGKISKLREDYQSAKLELNKLLQKKLINENNVGGMKADLDFLKNLEAKQMSLKLLNATMNSDLVFEDGNQQMEEFRNSSFPKVMIFSIAITMFFYLLSIVIRFLIDDRIYGEDDIRLYFKDLDFVGEVPSFE